MQTPRGHHWNDFVEFWAGAEPLDWSQWEVWTACLVFGGTIALVWASIKQDGATWPKEESKGS